MEHMFNELVRQGNAMGSDIVGKALRPDVVAVTQFPGTHLFVVNVAEEATMGVTEVSFVKEPSVQVTGNPIADIWWQGLHDLLRRTEVFVLQVLDPVPDKSHVVIGDQRIELPSAE
jgi:hypothetical protein